MVSYQQLLRINRGILNLSSQVKASTFPNRYQ
ncbi:MAG TPA: hypothetical protein DDZ89_16155 [Clostridiales bacterium]|nr:hypothetical protein [Clostridiales bacterium]